MMSVTREDQSGNTSQINVQSRTLKKLFTTAGTVVVILYIVGAVFPSSWNWGFHHFGFLPLYITVPAIVLMALALLPPVQQILLDRFERMIRQIHQSGTLAKYFFAFIMLAGAVAVFWVCSAKTSFLGDGSMVLRTLPTFPGTVFIPKTAFHNEPLVSYILIHIDRLCSALNLEPSHPLAYQIVAAASGVAAIIVLMIFSRKLFRETIDCALFSLFILAAGGSALFFGYVENYSPTYTAVLLYCITGAAFLRRELHPLAPSIAYGILFSCHFGMIVFLPSLIYIFYRAWTSKGVVIAISCMAATVLTSEVLLWISGYTWESFIDVFLKSEKHLLPITGPTGDYQAYTLLSLAHGLDVVNLLLLISPFAVAVVLAGIGLFRKELVREELWLFLLLVICCTLGFVIIVNATLGMSRDWDLLAPLMLGVTFGAGVFALELVLRLKVSRQIVLTLTMITLCSTAGWVAVNADETASVTRFGQLQDKQLWGRIAMTSAYEELSVYYRNKNDVTRTLEYIDKFIALDSLNPRMWASRGMALFRFEGNTPQTIQSFERALALGAKEWGVYLNLGVGYAENGRFHEALKLFTSALELNPRSEVILNNIGITHIKLNSAYDKALPFFLKAINENPQYPHSYKNAALCYLNMKDYKTARSYLERYRQFVPDDPESDVMMKAIEPGGR